MASQFKCGTNESQTKTKIQLVSSFLKVDNCPHKKSCPNRQNTHFSAVTFEIGGSGSDRGDPKTPNNEEEPEWECVWKCHTATPVHHMSFSPDGTLFATSGKSDRLVKIWYENKNGE